MISAASETAITCLKYSEESSGKDLWLAFWYFFGNMACPSALPKNGPDLLKACASGIHHLCSAVLPWMVADDRGASLYNFPNTASESALTAAGRLRAPAASDTRPHTTTSCSQKAWSLTVHLAEVVVGFRHLQWLRCHIDILSRLGMLEDVWFGTPVPAVLWL